MSQPITNSSPLSSPPTSLLESTAAGSSSSTQSVSPSPSIIKVLQPDVYPTTTASTTISSPATNESAKESYAKVDSPVTSNSGKARAPKAAAKRTRKDIDEDVGGSSPPKKPATQKRNVKSVTKSKVAEKATTKESAPAKAAPVKAPSKNTPPQKVIPPARSNTRPSRNHKAPERFENIQEKPKLKALPNKKGASKVFDPTFITTNSTSRLSKADIYHMLLKESAWLCLSAEQQTELLLMLPVDPNNKALLNRIKNGELDETRPQAFKISNDCFRTDVAKFQEDLKNGHLGKTWQASAEQAVIERAAGEYDDWKAAEAESWWGQKSS